MTDPRDARIAELEELLNASKTARLAAENALQAAETARLAAENALQAAETARQAAEEERDAFRQVLAFWDVLVAYIQQQQRGGAEPLSCLMAARLV